MSGPLVLLMAVLATLTALWGLGARHRFLMFPVMAALVYLGWVLPQAIFIAAEDRLPRDGVVIILTMACLSLVAIILGWRRTTAGDPSNDSPVYVYAPERLLLGAAVLSLVGAYFYVALWSLPEDMLRDSQWSGPQTIFVFFSKLQWLGLTLAWLLWLRHRRIAALGIVVFNLVFIVEPILLGARRSGMAELVLIILAGLWFTRRWVPSRPMLIAGAVAAVLIVNAIGAIRAVTTELLFSDDWPSAAEFADALAEIDYVAATMGEGRRIETSEFALGAAWAAAVHRDAVFNFGTRYWDVLVHRHVPGQIVGYDLKSNLQFQINPDLSRYFDSRFVTGLTLTGFYDAFAAFWFLGVVVFWAIARILRCLYDAASRGEIWAQYAYAYLSVDAVLSITHGTVQFFAGMPLLLLPSAAIFFFASSHKRNRSVF